jgi:hypothetical protein
MSVATTPTLYLEEHGASKVIRIEDVARSLSGSPTIVNGQTYIGNENGFTFTRTEGQRYEYRNTVVKQLSKWLRLQGNSETLVYNLQYDEMVPEPPNNKFGSVIQMWDANPNDPKDFDGIGYLQRVYADGKENAMSFDGLTFNDINTEFVGSGDVNRNGGRIYSRHVTAKNFADAIYDNKDVCLIENATLGEAEHVLREHNDAVIVIANSIINMGKGKSAVQVDHGTGSNVSKFYYFNCLFNGFSTLRTQDINVKDGDPNGDAWVKANAVEKLTFNPFIDPDTTAAAALWAGHPLLVNPGTSFFGRDWKAIDLEVQAPGGSFTTYNGLTQANGYTIGDLVALAPAAIEGIYYIRARFRDGSDVGPWSDIMAYEVTGSGLDVSSVDYDATPSGGTSPTPTGRSIYLENYSSTWYARAEETKHLLSSPDYEVTNFVDISKPINGDGLDASAISRDAEETMQVNGANIVHYETGIDFRNGTGVNIYNVTVENVASTTDGGAGIRLTGISGNSSIQRAFLSGNQQKAAMGGSRGVMVSRGSLSAGGTPTTFVVGSTMKGWSGAAVGAQKNVYLIYCTLQGGRDVLQAFKGATITLVGCDVIADGADAYAWLGDETSAIRYWNTRFDGKTAPPVDMIKIEGKTPFEVRSIASTRVTALQSNPLLGGAGATLHPAAASAYEYIEWRRSANSEPFKILTHTMRGDRILALDTTQDGSFQIDAEFIV